MELAQLGADGHRERRQIEFRVFILDITLLVIGLYQVNKPEDPMFKEIRDEGDPWLLVIPILVLIVLPMVF